jgi:hypothetical protein
MGRSGTEGRKGGMSQKAKNEIRFYDENGVEIGGWGFELADRVHYYVEHGDTAFAKIAFYFFVFTGPFWFTVITVAKLIKSTYHVAGWFVRCLRSAYRTTKQERQKYQQR